MRILLATEGISDELVAESLIRTRLPDAQIEAKKFPARGISVVQRLLPDIVRAAHFGHYDLLIVHFDLDDTFDPNSLNLSDNSRWKELEKIVEESRLKLKDCQRTAELGVVFMAAAQATDAWLAWGLDGGDGKAVEREDRHRQKERLYGKPPRRMREQASLHLLALHDQMQSNPDWPSCLRHFLIDLERFSTVSE